MRSCQTIRLLRGCSGAISSPLHDLETGGGRADARASCPPSRGAPLSGVPPGRCTGRGGVGRALSRHGSAWPVMLRAAGTVSQGPAPGRAGPLSGNAKPEAWLPDLRRYSKGFWPASGCLAKRRDTALPPNPSGATVLVLLCAVLHGRGTGSALPWVGYSLTLAEQCPEVPACPRQSPAIWPLVVGRLLVAWPGGTFLHSEPGLHRLPWGNL